MKNLSQRTLPAIQRVAFGEHEMIVPRSEASRRYKEVCASAQRAWNSIHEVHGRRMSDESLMPFARLQQSADHAQGHMKRVLAEYEAAQAANLIVMEQLSNRLDEALRPPASAGHAAVDSEIRAWARAAKPEEIAAALNAPSPDKSVVRALATGPRFLSGLAEPLHERARSLHLENAAPEDWVQFNDLRQASAAAKMAVESLNAWSKELIDFESVDAHKKAQAA